MTNGNDIVDDIIGDDDAFDIFNEWHFSILCINCINISFILVPQKYLFHHLDQEYCLDLSIRKVPVL